MVVTSITALVHLFLGTVRLSLMGQEAVAVDSLHLGMLLHCWFDTVSSVGHYALFSWTHGAFPLFMVL